jgi:TraG P-loop domain
MMAAQRDSKGNLRIDVTAQVAEAELLKIQQDLIASSLKAVKVSLTIGVRTSKAAHTTAEYEEAEREIASRKQQILHIISRMNGASGLTEDIAQRRIFLSSLPGLAGEDKREIDLLSCHAVDLLPLEMPWTGTPRSPLMLIETPYRQLIPFSPFDPDLSDANMLVAAASGHGKSMMTGQMLLQAARQDTRVSIIERGDSYRNLVEYMGGQMITMALDSEQTLNPWDLESGEREPSREQVAFLNGLTRHMLGDVEASDLLDNVLVDAIERTYRRAAMRPGNTIPTFGEPERVAWAEALHHVSSRGNGKGGVMLYAFPQELVDAVASATGGGRVRVKPPKLGALMRVEANSFYLEGEGGRTLLFRYDPVNRMVFR